MRQRLSLSSARTSLFIAPFSGYKGRQIAVFLPGSWNGFLFQTFVLPAFFFFLADFLLRIFLFVNRLFLCCSSFHRAAVHMLRNHFVPPARMRLPVQDMREPAARSPAEAENMAERAVIIVSTDWLCLFLRHYCRLNLRLRMYLCGRTWSVPAETQVRIEAPDDTGFRVAWGFRNGLASGAGCTGWGTAAAPVPGCCYGSPNGRNSFMPDSGAVICG